MAQNFRRLWGRGDWLAVTVSVVEDLNLFSYSQVFLVPLTPTPLLGLLLQTSNKVF